MHHAPPLVCNGHGRHNCLYHVVSASGDDQRSRDLLPWIWVMKVESPPRKEDLR
jgi:hypothetical protein